VPTITTDPATTKREPKQYPFLWAWEFWLGGERQLTETMAIQIAELESEAIETKAPADAICKRYNTDASWDGRSWRQHKDITKTSLREKIALIAENYQ
jgi:hypothetical protein